MHFTDKIWKHMLENLFSKKTHLFYDFTVKGMEGEFEKYLPDVKLVQAQIPNPCGWDTGMEDGMIIGGIMLDSAVENYRLTGNKEMLDTAREIFSGIKACASISSSEGFLARNISPIDLKSYYIDSSRDQYTHWIYSSVNYINSGMASDEDTAFIKKTLIAFARRALKNVTEENGYNLLREDGGRGIVTAMWGNIDAHEWMRLPMFYLAAWQIGGDASFKEAYYNTRDEALLRSEEVNLPKYLKLFALHQMQLSLRLVYDLDPDEEFKGRYLSLMEKVSDYACKRALSLVEAHKKEDILKGKVFETKPWTEIPADFSGYIDGYAYFVPRAIKSWASKDADWSIYSIGDGISTYTLLPNAKLNNKLLDALEFFGASIDYETYRADSVCHLLTPYYTLKILENK
jgi:hypothetical protein